MSDVTLYIWSEFLLLKHKMLFGTSQIIPEIIIVRFCHDEHTDIAHTKISCNINIKNVQLN